MSAYLELPLRSERTARLDAIRERLKASGASEEEIELSLAKARNVHAFKDCVNGGVE
jgi:hypothetical protein